VLSLSLLTRSRGRCRSLYALPALALLLFPGGLYAGTYYVASSGDDSNAGTSTSPVRTVQRGIDLAGPGDTVIVRDGTYGRNGCASDSDYAVSISKAGTSSAYITIKAEHKWGAVLDGEQVCHSYVNFGSGAAYIVFQDFVVTRSYWSALWANSSAHHIVIRGNRLENVGNWLDTTTPYGFTGLYTGASANNITIDGNVLHDIGRNSGSVNHDHALYLHGSYFTITNNLFYNNKHGWDIQTADTFQNVLIANNTFMYGNPSRDGNILLWGTGQSNITIRNNIFYKPTNYAVVYCGAAFSGTNVADYNIAYGASAFSGGDECGGGSGSFSIGTNLTADPMLMNTSTAPYDIHLRAGSPAIDAGAAISAVTTDFDGNKRPQGAAYDIGATEYGSSVSAPTPPVISGVSVSSVASDSAVVSWTTDKPADSSVEYGIGGYSATTPVNSSMLTSHSVMLSNLAASTLYHFRVDSRDSSGNLATSGDYTFTTAAAVTVPTTPPTTGDTGSGSGTGTLYVATTGSDSNPGTSMSPLATIQRAVDLAGPGATIIVRDGTYGRGGCASDSDYAVSIGKAGTSSAYITIKSEHKWGAVLDAQQVCHSYVNFGDGAAYIVFQDFVVTRGYWSALWVNSSAHHIVIRGNRLENVGNWLDTTTPYGFTGIYTGAPANNITIDGNVLHDIGRNSGSVNHDHALYLYGSNFTITNNVFYNNTKGWSIQTADGFQNALIANNTFAFGNPNRDGHILLWGSGLANITIRNNIFYKPTNYAVVYCGAAFSGTNSFDHNIAYGVSAFSGGDECGGATGTNTISMSANNMADPKLVNASTAPYDFHLVSGSPAIDAGTAVSSVNDDFDGDQRPQGSGYDIGAFEYMQSTATPAPAPSFAFTLSASPASVSVVKGQSGSSVITAALAAGTSQAVTFAASSLPAGVTASFATASCKPACSTGMTLAVSSSAQSGTYTLTVTATGGGASSSASVTLTITDPAAPPAPSTTGLVAWWKLDESKGWSAADSSGNGNTGTFVGRAGWQMGGAWLNGSSYISVKESASIEQSTALTVSFWIRDSDWGNVAARLVTKSYSWDVKLNGSARYPQFTSGNKYAALNYSLPLNKWQHVVFTFSNGVIKGYINGSPVSLLTNTFTGNEVLPLVQAGLNIGADATGSNYAQGVIDDVRLYNRALSASEISTLYSQTLH
jgi:hypothetical protein